MGRVPNPDRHPRGGGISLTTLVLASAGSACAAFVVSRVWGTGTLIGAAVTPVIVAIVTEVLRRPATKLPELVTPGKGKAAPEQLPGDVPASVPGPQDAPLVEQMPVEAPMQVYRAGARSGLGPREWRIVGLTGLAAFVIGIGVYVGVDRLAGGEGRLVPEGATPAGTVTTDGTQTMTVVTQQQSTITSETVTVQRESTVTAPAEPAPPTTSTTPTTPTTEPTQAEDPAAPVG